MDLNSAMGSRARKARTPEIYEPIKPVGRVKLGEQEEFRIKATIEVLESAHAQRAMAEYAGLPFLAYLLEMVVEEARGTLGEHAPEDRWIV